MYTNMYYNTSSLFYLSRLRLNSVKNFSAKLRKISRKSWKISRKYLKVSRKFLENSWKIFLKNILMSYLNRLNFFGKYFYFMLMAAAS